MWIIIIIVCSAASATERQFGSAQINISIVGFFKLQVFPCAISIAYSSWEQFYKLPSLFKQRIF